MDILQTIKQNVSLSESKAVLENILVQLYFQPGIPVKDLARKVFLPVPVVSAIKNEFKTINFLTTENGMRLTHAGNWFVEDTLQYKNLDLRFYQMLKTLSVDNPAALQDFINTHMQNELTRLAEIYENRPSVDVTIDQSKCTPITGLKRAILCFLHDALIGKNILCIGDDDCISAALSLLVARLFPDGHPCNITVVDVDTRILEYLTKLAQPNIQCIEHDLKNPLPSSLTATYDCLFTDPPYTLPGLALFLQRGLSVLQKESGLPIFLSFAHKAPEFQLAMQKQYTELNLLIAHRYSNFNFYEGAQVIGGTSDMTVLNTTRYTTPHDATAFTDPIYTGELKKTIRLYECTSCQTKIKVGLGEPYKTIESLKESRCVCGSEKFKMIERKNQNV